MPLVKKDLWDWVQDPTDPEKLPIWAAEILFKEEAKCQPYAPPYSSPEDFAKRTADKIKLSSSAHNDAALSAFFVSSAHGEAFFDVKSAMDYVRDNNIVLEDSYEGYIY